MLRTALIAAACLVASPLGAIAEVKPGALNSTAERPRTVQPLVLADASTGVSNAEAKPVSLTTQLKGFYITGALGGNWPQAVNARSTDANASPYGYQDFHNSGVSIEAGAGYDFGPLRAEVTYAYDASALAGSATIRATPPTPAQGG